MASTIVVVVVSAAANAAVAVIDVNVVLVYFIPCVFRIEFFYDFLFFFFAGMGMLACFSLHSKGVGKGTGIK